MTRKTEGPDNDPDLSKEEKILLLIDQKADLSEEIAQVIMEEPQLLDTVLQSIYSETGRVKFRCAKILKIISLKKPEILMEHWNFFVNLLESENKIILWNALDIIANLTAVDQEHKFDDVYPHYYKFLEDESMVTAAHVVENSDQIITNRPDLEGEITLKLLDINKIPRDGECADILSGKALGVFDKHYKSIDDKKKVLEFALNASQSKRNATKIRADKFMKKHD
ncbi:MAG: hypothetical protein LUQ24_04305 [Methanobacterium sp.]|nr:hypothetical protein [Methanobacterium sp.]